MISMWVNVDVCLWRQFCSCRFDEQLRELKEEHEQQLQLQQLNFAEVQAIKTKQLENQIRTKLEVRKSHEK